MRDQSDKEQLVRISSLLQKVIYRKKWQKRVELHGVFVFWDKVVGEDIAVHAQPAVINGNVLWVEVSDSAWMQQLSYMKYSLLEEINKRLRPEHLEDIRFRLGLVGLRPTSVQEATRKQQPDTGAREEFEQLLGVVSDKDIRDSLGKLWLAFAGNKK